MKRLSRHGSMVVACTIFLGLGLVTASLGPALPDLAAKTGSGLASLGWLFTALFLGALLSISVAGTLSDKLGQVPVLLAGVLLTGLGTFGFTLMTSLPLMLALALVAGVGHGAVDIATNVLVARLFPDRSVAALNLLNVFFGVGAMVGPAVAGLTMRLYGTGLSGLWLGGGLMLIAFLLVPMLPGRPAPERERAAIARGASPLRSPLLWTLGLLILLYVGVENGIGGWATTYLTATTTLDKALSSLVTSGFWMALTAGRMLTVGLGSRFAPERLLQLFLAGSLAGGLLLLLSTGSTALSITAILLLGFSFGPVFPTTVGIATTTFPQAPGTASSVVIAMGGLGGMMLPWFQGVLMEGAGPRISIVVIAAGTLGMLLLLQAAAKLLRSGGQPARAE